jgi:ATP-dependent exoDNAse (exonuclease V) beta subunit
MSTQESLQKTIQVNGKRYYIINETTKYPSVTTILGSFGDKSGIEQWKKRVGEEEAERISKYSANRGTVMHQLCEYYLTSSKTDYNERLSDANDKLKDFLISEDFSKNEIECGIKLFYNFYDSGCFNNIESVISAEDMLFSHRMGGYAGRVDIIYRNKNSQPVILDFKSATKPKREDWIENYKLQISAYFLAYWEMTGERPCGGEIWISNEVEPYPQIFKLNLEEIKRYSKKFLQLVKLYHEQYPLTENI